jgi:hypothetical protein
MEAENTSSTLCSVVITVSFHSRYGFLSPGETHELPADYCAEIVDRLKYARYATTSEAAIPASAAPTPTDAVTATADATESQVNLKSSTAERRRTKAKSA